MADGPIPDDFTIAGERILAALARLDEIERRQNELTQKMLADLSAAITALKEAAF